MSPYETLGVSATAKQDEIKSAYRNLAKKYHPDLNPGNKEAEKKFKQINTAYEQVGTPEARAKYDRGESESESQEGFKRGRQGPFYHQTQESGGRYSAPFGGMDQDFFESIFGRMGGAGGGRSGDMPGEDVVYQMDVSFEDAARGAEREITLPNGKRLRVRIPAGVESGTRLRFAGQGESGAGKGQSGDAYVQLQVKSSPLFRRVGKDIELELPISVSEAILGTEVKVPSLEGSLLLKVPPGVSSGQRLRVSGMGVPDLKDGKKGDQYVILKIVLPQAFDPEFKREVEAWSRRQPFDPRANLGANWGANSEGRKGGGS